jgi:hypothetical protein
MCPKGAGSMDGDVLSAVYMGQGGVFMYHWKREPEVSKGEDLLCGGHKFNSMRWLGIPPCSTERCRLAASAAGRVGDA